MSQIDLNSDEFSPSKKAIKTTSTRNKRRKEVLNISIDQKFYIKNKFKRVSPRVVKCSFCTQKINNNHFTRYISKNTYHQNYQLHKNKAILLI